ncbi:hypothetical protein AWENTII_008953 [Aspergillus wentii]
MQSIAKRRMANYAIAIATFLSAAFLYSLANRHHPEHAPYIPATGGNAPLKGVVNEKEQHNNTPCYVDTDLIKTLGYEYAGYARWEIAVVQTDNFSGFEKKLDLPVPSEYQVLKLNSPERKLALPAEYCTSNAVIEAPIPPRSRVDASSLVFGVSTSLERLDESLDAFAHWAAGTNTRIIALVDSQDHWSRVQRRAARMGINLTIIKSSEDTLDRYFSLTRILLQNRESADWGVIIDDDTFFPSMSNLINELKHYDPSKSWYIGAPTENFAQMSMFSYMAYGGAGVFLSMPLLEQMDESFDECYAWKDDGGDKRVARCVYMHTDTKLTWDHGLFQLDLWEASGFYESGRRLPLSIHHWKSWFHTDVVGMGKVASICGDNCQLNRWRISDEWFLINGFSIIQHSYPVSDKDLLAMEQTWDPSPWAREEGYTYSLGPLRPMDEQKISFRLKTATEDGNRVRQIYVLEPPEGNPDPPRVLEIVWRVMNQE